MKQIFSVFGLVVVCLCGILLYCLLPYLKIISLILAGIVLLGIVLILLLCISFTFTRMSIWNSERKRHKLNCKVIAYGDVVAYPTGKHTFVHLSAIHGAAKYKGPKELPPPDEGAVMELYNMGLTIKHIAEQTGRSQYQVKKIIYGK